jgi:hypothetical protein
MILPKTDLTEMRVEFERCWPWLWASLCQYGPTHNKEHVWMRLSTGKAFLWPSKQCAIVGELIDYPIGLRAFNYWLQGGKLTELQSMHVGIEAWAIAKGAKLGRGEGRDGWVEAMGPGWQKHATVRIKWLTDDPPHAP